MTFYMWIKALQQPFDAGVDQHGRCVVSFNIHVRKKKSDTFERELVTILVAAGVGTFGSTLFSGTKTVLPNTGTVTLIVPTAGLEGVRTQGVPGYTYTQEGAMIRVHAATIEAAMAKARAAFSALTVVTNANVSAA